LEAAVTTAAYLAIYAGVLIFLAGCLRRIVIYARAPLHLRWELYPVPHEEPDRAKHGGSYFESTEWWRKSQAFHRFREWAAMFQEIAFLKSLRESNPRLWIPSFLFHGGLYLSICAVAVLMAVTESGILFPGSQITQISAELLPPATWVGFAGEILVLAGALLLLVRRMTDAALKNYTKPSDIFNLLFFLVAFAFLAAGSFVRATNAASVGEISRGILRFDRSIDIGVVLATGLILASALVAWIPFTHMSHFIAKYFTWHSVRWDDRRMERGSPIETKVAAYMNYHPTWAALHLAANGEKSWAEIAAAAPTSEVRK
jgi:nitrate reductase gamma subunit